MRPIGGWLFGYIASKRSGSSMLLSVCASVRRIALVIACLPTYESIGGWAPALLLIARCSRTSVGRIRHQRDLSEVAIKGDAAFTPPFRYVTLIGGQLLALLVLVILQRILPQEMKPGDGIPFAWGRVGSSCAVPAFAE